MLVEGRTVWEFAMAMAVHIHNRSFRSGVNDLPPKLLTRASPDLSYSRTFGCLAFVHVMRVNRLKIAHFAHEEIFVGYSPDSPALLLWMPDTKTILANRSVAFIETDRIGYFDVFLDDECCATSHTGCGFSTNGEQGKTTYASVVEVG
jgi:hypothetical protein